MCAHAHRRVRRLRHDVEWCAKILPLQESPHSGSMPPRSHLISMDWEALRSRAMDNAYSYTDLEAELRTLERDIKARIKAAERQERFDIKPDREPRGDLWNLRTVCIQLRKEVGFAREGLRRATYIYVRQLQMMRARIERTARTEGLTIDTTELMYTEVGFLITVGYIAQLNSVKDAVDKSIGVYHKHMDYVGRFLLERRHPSVSLDGKSFTITHEQLENPWAFTQLYSQGTERTGTAFWRATTTDPKPAAAPVSLTDLFVDEPEKADEDDSVSV